MAKVLSFGHGHVPFVIPKEWDLCRRGRLPSRPEVDLRSTWGRPEANVLNVLVNAWNWMRSPWGWLEVDLQVYFVGTRPARFSKNVIYDIGAKIILLKKSVSFLTGISCFWKRFLQPFLDLNNSKGCTHVCNLLNLSDLKRLPIKHSKTRNTITNLKICMRPWIRRYQLFSS